LGRGKGRGEESRMMRREKEGVEKRLVRSGLRDRIGEEGNGGCDGGGRGEQRYGE